MGALGRLRASWVQPGDLLFRVGVNLGCVTVRTAFACVDVWSQMSSVRLIRTGVAKSSLYIALQLVMYHQPSYLPTSPYCKAKPLSCEHTAVLALRKANSCQYFSVYCSDRQKAESRTKGGALLPAQHTCAQHAQKAAVLIRPLKLRLQILHYKAHAPSRCSSQSGHGKAPASAGVHAPWTAAAEAIVQDAPGALRTECHACRNALSVLPRAAKQALLLIVKHAEPRLYLMCSMSISAQYFLC